MLGFVSAPAAADTSAEALTTCLLRSLTDADRTAMIRWTLFTLSQHPAASSFVNADLDNKDAVNREMAELIRKLYSVSCKSEVREALKTGGATSFQQSFDAFSDAIALEVVENDVVDEATQEWTKYIELLELAKEIMQ